MSRHEIKSGSNPALEITVGWDQPLQTYFVIVKDNCIDERDDRIICWAGASPQELYEIDDLQKVLQPYAIMGADLRQKLYADKDEGR